jgi:hypothetical protein
MKEESLSLRAHPLFMEDEDVPFKGGPNNKDDLRRVQSISDEKRNKKVESRMPGVICEALFVNLVYEKRQAAEKDNGKEDHRRMIVERSTKYSIAKKK